MSWKWKMPAFEMRAHMLVHTRQCTAENVLGEEEEITKSK